MMIVPPCKDCSKREVGCHCKCEQFKSYKEKKEAENKRKREYLQATYFIDYPKKK